MVFAKCLFVFPLASMARRRTDSERELFRVDATLSSSSVSNGTDASASVAGACDSCDTYGWAACGLCPNCKWRSEKCMHKCTSCCAYDQGCTADYCICNGKTNVFEDMWKSCGSQRGAKTYYFQIRVPHGPDHANDSFIAIEFQRSLDDPQLILHFNQEWTIQTIRQMTGCRQRDNGGHAPMPGALLEQTSITNQTDEHSGSADFSAGHGQSLVDVSQGQSRGSQQYIVCDWNKTLQWIPMPASQTDKPTTEIIHLADVEYIRVFKETIAKARMSVTVLEIKRPGSGDPLKIYGGLYIPPFAFEYAMDAFWPAGSESVPPPVDDGSGIYVSEPKVEYNKRGSSWWLWFDPEHLPVQYAHYRVSKMFEFLEEHLKDSGKSMPNQHQGAVVAAWFGGFFAGQVGAMTGAVSAGLLTASLGPVGIPLVFVGFLGGFALPFGSIVWGTTQGAEADTQRELRLLASEKIFEKMRCHELFQRCGGVAVAPGHGRCPYSMPRARVPGARRPPSAPGRPEGRERRLARSKDGDHHVVGGRNEFVAPVPCILLEG
ncbi:unnamed protein product [Prorocentrum cordatum]|uniref:PSI domain-containing protein n=1 Tax=Prorocentrum cordatum TaxID=2364126 RepID=A0ABN9SX78_9DINO|nr:unnamed protein product [Polarella glacialis]